MTLISFSPAWFHGYDVALEVGFAITALIIAQFAFKMYKATDQSQVKYFGIAFFLISISYIVQSFLNFLIAIQATGTTCGALLQQSIELFGTYGLLAHMLFMTAGFTMLAYMTFKVENIKIMWLMLIIAGIAILFSVSPLHAFFGTSTVLLFIVLWHFVKNYLQTKQTKTLLVVLAFGFLLFGRLHFLISVDHQLYYAIGHILELIAYILILANLYLVLRNDKKA